MIMTQHSLKMRKSRSLGLLLAATCILLILPTAALAQASFTAKSTAIVGRATMKDVDRQVESYREHHTTFAASKKGFDAARGVFIRQRCKEQQLKDCADATARIRNYYQQWVVLVRERLDLATSLFGQEAALGRMPKQEYDEHVGLIHALESQLNEFEAAIQKADTARLVEISTQLKAFMLKTDGLPKVLAASKRYTRSMDLMNIARSVRELHLRLQTIVDSLDISLAQATTFDEMMQQLEQKIQELERAASEHNAANARRHLLEIQQLVRTIKEGIEQREGRDFFRQRTAIPSTIKK